jgi:hypothetical protein
MQKRNVVLLIIVLVGITVLLFGYFYFFPNSTPAQIIENTAPNFFPFGNTPKKSAPAPANISNTGNENPSLEIPTVMLKLKKISGFPVAGFGIFAKEVFKEVVPTTPPVDITTTNKKTTAPKPTPPATEFVTTLRYVNRETGNVYQTRADQVDERQFTDTTIPQIHEAFFEGQSTAVIMRYLKEDGQTIETFLGSLPKDMLGADSSAVNEVKGSFLPENITDMSVSPDSSKIFYLFNANDIAVGITAGALGDKKSQIFSSPFTEWLSQWPNFKMITLTTKPSANVRGYMYAVDPDKKDFNKILSGINGLTTKTSPSGKLVLYSSSDAGSLNLYIYHTDTGNSDLLGAKTLPEKCAWTKASDALYCAVPKFLPVASYPDAWYQGLITFSDEIWKIDAVNSNATKLADPLEIASEEVDGTKLALDTDEKYLFFINKKDSYLWELNLR